MLRYVVCVASFVTYLILLSLCGEDKFPTSAMKTLIFGFLGYVVAHLLTLVASLLTNFAFFGDFLSPLEQQEQWVPILRAPLIEEGSKFAGIYVLARTIRARRNRLVRLAGSIGNWFFFVENIGFVWMGNISLFDTLFRLFPMHLSSAFIIALGMKERLSWKSSVFLVLAMTLHGVQNFLSIANFFVYIFFGFTVSSSLFAIILLNTRAPAAPQPQHGSSSLRTRGLDYYF
jgi:hypothetical protein